jgi:hypothetical protein
MKLISGEDNSLLPTTASATRQGRRELVVAGLFVFLFAGVPLLRTEFFPFSRAPMFADAPQRYCEYAVTDPRGQAVDLALFGLQRNYWGNPLGVGVGFRPVPGFDVFGEVPSQEAVTAHLRSVLPTLPDLDYVQVERTVYGPVDEWRIGLIETESWRVENPKCREAME